ncbi:MAG: hypothetical protein ACOH1X_02955 [Kaistella sp.]
MNRENLEEAYNLNLKITELEKKIDAWKCSHSFNGFDGKVQVRESGMPSNYFNINLKDIDFKDLSDFFIEKLEAKKEKHLVRLNVLIKMENPSVLYTKEEADKLGETPL